MDKVNNVLSKELWLLFQSGFGFDFVIRHGQCNQKKSSNVYKSCPKRISLEKWWILTPLQKLPKNVGDLGK